MVKSEDDKSPRLFLCVILWLANESFEMFVCVWRIWSEFYITHRKLVFPKHCTKENRCLSRINFSFMYTTSQILFLGRTIRWTSWLVLKYLTTKKTTGTCYYVKYTRILPLEYKAITRKVPFFISSNLCRSPSALNLFSLRHVTQSLVIIIFSLVVFPIFRICNV